SSPGMIEVLSALKRPFGSKKLPGLRDLTRRWKRVRIKLSREFSIGHIPKRDAAHEIGSYDLFAVVAESSPQRKFERACHGTNFISVGVPKNHSIVPTTT